MLQFVVVGHVFRHVGGQVDNSDVAAAHSSPYKAKLASLRSTPPPCEPPGSTNLLRSYSP